MNPEIKEKWLAALKSGEYQKAQNKLRINIGDNKYGYCCLGVLCDLHLKETGQGRWGELGEYTTERDWEKNWLTREVMEWAGVDDKRGKFVAEQGDQIAMRIEEDFGQVTLDLVNDIKNEYDPTFQTVIRYIEKHF